MYRKDSKLLLPILIHAIVQSDIGWSKLMNKSLTEHEQGEDMDSFKDANQVLSKYPSLPFFAIKYPIDGGIVTNPLYDWCSEFLISIHK